MAAASSWLLRQGEIQPMTTYFLPYPKMCIILAGMNRLTWEIQGYFLSNRYLSCKDRGEGSWIWSPMYYTVGRHPNLEFQKQMCSQLVHISFLECVFPHASCWKSHLPKTHSSPTSGWWVLPHTSSIPRQKYLAQQHALAPCGSRLGCLLLWSISCCLPFCLPSLLWRTVLPCWW